MTGAKRRRRRTADAGERVLGGGGGRAGRGRGGPLAGRAGCGGRLDTSQTLYQCNACPSTTAGSSKSLYGIMPPACPPAPTTTAGGTTLRRGSSAATASTTCSARSQRYGTGCERYGRGASGTGGVSEGAICSGVRAIMCNGSRPSAPGCVQHWNDFDVFCASGVWGVRGSWAAGRPAGLLACGGPSCIRSCSCSMQARGGTSVHAGCPSATVTAAEQRQGRRRRRRCRQGCRGWRRCRRWRPRRVEDDVIHHRHGQEPDLRAAQGAGRCSTAVRYSGTAATGGPHMRE